VSAGNRNQIVHSKNCFGSVYSSTACDRTEQSLQRAHQQRTAVFRAMYRPVLRLIQVGNVGFPARIRAGPFPLQGTSTAADSTVHIIILSNNHQLSFPASSPLLLTQPQSLSFTARNTDGRCSLCGVDWMFNKVHWHYVLPQNCLKRLLPSSCLSVCLPICLSVRMEHLGSHWRAFHEIRCLSIFGK